MQSVGVRGVEGGSPSGVAKSKTAFKDMALPQQAGIRCGDAQFQIFLSGMLGAKHPSEGSREAWTQEAVRFHCGVESRAELSTNHEAANKWRELESQYQSWLADRQYGDMQR